MTEEILTIISINLAVLIWAICKGAQHDGNGMSHLQEVKREGQAPREALKGLDF